MGYIIAGLAIAAAGAGVSASGTAANAEAQKDAALNNILLENKFAKKWTGRSDQLQADQLDKLYNLGNIFDRFESTGAFGDTSVLKNLRTAQEDFAALGAGDFSKFEGQLRSVMQDNLVSTFGAGAPIGTYAGLSADSIMNFRRQGVSDATAITGFLSGEANNLLGMEFGIMNQGFERGFAIDRKRLDTAQGNYQTAASTAGVGTSAWGGALQSVGTSLVSYGMGSMGSSGGSSPKAIPLTESGQPIGYSVGSNGYYTPSAPVYNPASYGSVRPASNPNPSYVPRTATFLPEGRSTGTEVGMVLPPLDPYQNVPEVPMGNQAMASNYWNPYSLKPYDSLVSLLGAGGSIVR